jgi:hypothetical protein
MKCPDHAIGNRFPKHVGTLAANRPGVEKSGSHNLRLATRHTMSLLFDTKKVHAGMSRGHADKKRSPVAPEVDLEQRGPGLKPLGGNLYRITRQHPAKPIRRKSPETRQIE